MCTLLVVFLLAAAAPATSGDSLQYCSSERATWRIRTQAGVAVELVQVSMTPSTVELLADEEARAEFGMAIERKLTIIGADDSAALLAALQRHRLRGQVVTDDARGFAYWRAAASR